MTIQGNSGVRGAAARALQYMQQGAANRPRQVDGAPQVRLAPHEITLYATALLRDAPKAVNQKSRELDLGNGMIVRVPATNDAAIIRHKNGGEFSGLSVALNSQGQITYTIDLNEVASDSEALCDWGALIKSASETCKAVHHGHGHTLSKKLSQSKAEFRKLMSRPADHVASIEPRRPGDGGFAVHPGGTPAAAASSTASASATPEPCERDPADVMGALGAAGVPPRQYVEVARESLRMAREKLPLGGSRWLDEHLMVTLDHLGEGYTVRDPDAQKWLEVHSEGGDEHIDLFIKLNNESIRPDDLRAGALYRIMQRVSSLLAQP